MSAEDSPPYTSSVPAPAYSREPKADEERLAFTARLQRPRHNSQFRRTARRIALTLNEQDAKAAIPVYDSNSLVSGTITLSDCSCIRSVVVKLECRIILHLEAGNSESEKILSESHALWTQEPGQICPDTHDFAIPFSSVYTSQGRTRSLPPSYTTPFLAGFSAKCIYKLKIRVNKTSRTLTFWNKHRKLDVVLNYRPRTRPTRPILYAPLLRSIKSGPDEWYQSVSSIPARRDSKAAAVTCALFIPSVQIYSLSDVIPFHIQLSAPLASLRILMGGAHSSTTKSKSIGLRVFLSREISVDVHGNREMRKCDHSESTLRALPPPEWNYDNSGEQDEISLDFEGELQCDGRIDTVGFVTDNLVVRDFIVVSWKPSGPSQAQFQPFRHSHQIKLVTDPWTEQTEYPHLST